MGVNSQLTSPTEVRALLNQLGHRPNRGLGQNYLIDANILDGIVQLAAVDSTDGVLEIGPGLGALTERILAQTADFRCIEKDPTMAEYLRSRFSGVEVMQADAMEVDLNTIFAAGVNKVVANLPYSVASRLMVEMAESTDRPERMCLTIQKEVADRLTAQPGSRAYGVLSVLTGFFYESRLAKKVSPTCFLPSPKVWSAVVQMDRRSEAWVEADEYPMVKRLVKHCFSQRRKQIATSLKNLGIKDVEELLLEVEISPKERPEQLEPLHWVSMARWLQSREA